jgi:hypothetical protein
MTNFELWLRRLAAAQLRVDSIPPAFNGLKWEEPIEIEGDWTGATLEGSVCIEPNATPLASFTITGPVVADGVSTWTASLAAGTGANSTGKLWSDAGDTDGDAVIELAAMFRLTPNGGSKSVLMGGVFSVLEQA